MEVVVLTGHLEVVEMAGHVGPVSFTTLALVPLALSVAQMKACIYILFSGFYFCCPCPHCCHLSNIKNNDNDGYSKGIECNYL